MAKERQEQRPFAPRRMELADLVGVLVKEHVKMREGIRRTRTAAGQKDFEEVHRALNDVVLVFRQHVVDEEAQILGLLVAKLGVNGAEAELAVFRQHRPIYLVMQRLGELAERSPAELEADQAMLERLFEEHAALEESRVFPKAVALGC